MYYGFKYTQCLDLAHHPSSFDVNGQTSYAKGTDDFSSRLNSSENFILPLDSVSNVSLSRLSSEFIAPLVRPGPFKKDKWHYPNAWNEQHLVPYACFLYPGLDNAKIGPKITKKNTNHSAPAFDSEHIQLRKLFQVINRKIEVIGHSQPLNTRIFQH